MLAGIVAAAFAAAAAYVLRLDTYFVMPDELGYAKQAFAIGESLSPLTPGDFWFLSWAQLQPMLNAPAYALFDTPSAFDGAHLTNALVMASTAIPAYLLARPLVPMAAWGYAAAALTVAVPWLALSGTLMTEATAYAAFAWALLAMHRAIAAPSARGDILALAAITAAFLARTQFIVLGAVFLAAIALHELAHRPEHVPGRGAAAHVRGALSRAVAGHPVATAGAVAAVGSLFLIGYDELLGSYRLVTRGTLLPEGAFDEARELVAYVAVGTGVLPFVVSLAWALPALARRGSRERHAFAALLVTVTIVLVAMAGSFSAQFTTGVNDRYLFYLAPLLSVGMVVGLTSRDGLVLPVLLAGALMTWVVAGAELAGAGPTLVSPSATFHPVLEGRAPGDLGAAELAGSATALATAALAVGLLRLRRLAVGAAAVLAVLAFCVIETGYVLDKIADSQQGASADFLAGRDWVDDALPDDARAVAVLAATGSAETSPVAWWDAVFWNKQVDRVAIAEGGPRFEQAFSSRFRLDPATGELTGLDSRDWIVRARDDVRFGLQEARLAARRNGLELLEVPAPRQAAWALLGTNDGGALPEDGRAVARAYVRGATGPSNMTLVFTATGEEPAEVRLRTGGNTLRVQIVPGEPAEVTVPLAASGRTADVRVSTARGAGVRIAAVRLG